MPTFQHKFFILPILKSNSFWSEAAIPGVSIFKAKVNRDRDRAFSWGGGGTHCTSGRVPLALQNDGERRVRTPWFEKKKRSRFLSNAPYNHIITHRRAKPSASALLQSPCPCPFPRPVRKLAWSNFFNRAEQRQEGKKGVGDTTLVTHCLHFDYRRNALRVKIKFPIQGAKYISV